MKSSKIDLDIGAVARASGLTPATLRFYEARGLIESTGRRGLRRMYSANVLERLALVALGRSAGFSLEEIGSMLIHGPEAGVTKQRLAEKARELDVLIRKLTVARDGLLHAVECKAPHFMACPHFRRVLTAASERPVEPLPVQPPTPSTRRAKSRPKKRPRGRKTP